MAERLTRTLLLAISFPDVIGDPNEADPEDIADLLRDIINKERMRNWPDRANRVDVSLFPPPQWMSETTMERLRGFDGRPRRGDEVEAWLEEWLQATHKYVHHNEIANGHAMLRELLNDYRRHADAGVPLSEEEPRG